MSLEKLARFNVYNGNLNGMIDQKVYDLKTGYVSNQVLSSTRNVFQEHAWFPVCLFPLSYYIPWSRLFAELEL